MMDPMLTLTNARTLETTRVNCLRIEVIQPVAGGTMLVMKSGWTVVATATADEIEAIRAEVWKSHDRQKAKKATSEEDEGGNASL